MDQILNFVAVVIGLVCVIIWIISLVKWDGKNQCDVSQCDACPFPRCDKKDKR